MIRKKKKRKKDEEDKEQHQQKYQGQKSVSNEMKKLLVIMILNLNKCLLDVCFAS